MSVTKSTVERNVDATCSTCMYWRDLRPKANPAAGCEGMCRRDPPTGDGNWPHTAPDSWCGAHPQFLKIGAK